MTYRIRNGYTFGYGYVVVIIEEFQNPSITPEFVEWHIDKPWNGEVWVI
jgi:hypothetical protein